MARGFLSEDDGFDVFTDEDEAEFFSDEIKWLRAQDRRGTLNDYGFERLRLLESVRNANL